MGKIRFRRGLDADRQNITPDSGEPIWTTDKKELWVGDGNTQGGIKVSGVTTWLGLTDTPASFAEAGDKLIKVKPTEDGLEFVAQGSGSGLDADKVDGAHKSDLEATMDSKISTHASDASAHHTKTTSSEIDHGSVQGLDDDDHPQYLNTARHDTTSRHPLGSVVPHDDHGNLSGLGDDDHPQYLLADASRLVSGHLRPDTDVTYNLGASALRWNVIYVAGAYFYGDTMPGADNSYSFGSSTLRWSDIYAVNTHWGDLGFVETTCPKCGKEFEIGDNIILRVIRFDDESGGIMTVPIHLECANLSPKTIKRKCPVKEHYYVWDEEKGEVVKGTRNKTVKKKVKKKRIKSGYELDMETGKIWKLKKQAKKSVRDKIVEETEAVEEVEEEIEEVLYEEKEFVI